MDKEFKPPKGESPEPPARRRLRLSNVAWLVVFGLICVGSLLFSPPMPAGYREDLATSLRLSGTPRLHVTINCDSWEFLRLAQQPSRLLERGSLYQSRPGYAVIGFGMAVPFRLLGLDHRLESGRSPDFAPEYAGYILFNGILLLATLYLFVVLCGRSSLFALALPLVLLSCNEVTKAFFWTPHMQIFNLFMPIASVAINRWLLTSRPEPSWRSLLGMSALLGVCLLVYGAFIVCMGSALVCLVWGRRNASENRRVPGSALLKAAVCGVVFLLPILGWAAFVKWQAGDFYSHEIVAYRQFIWIIQALREGPAAFLDQLTRFSGLFSTVVVKAAWLPLLATGLVMGVSAARRVPAVAEEKVRHTTAAVLFYEWVAVPFYALMGFYATRLAWALVPPLLLILTVQTQRLLESLDKTPSRAVGAGLFLLSIVCLLYQVLSAGPYF